MEPAHFKIAGLDVVVRIFIIINILGNKRFFPEFIGFFGQPVIKPIRVVIGMLAIPNVV